MGFRKRELIQFFDRMMELVREECQIEAKILVEMFLIAFKRRWRQCRKLCNHCRYGIFCTC